MDSSILWLAVPMGGLVLLNLTDKLPAIWRKKPEPLTGAICPCQHAINFHEQLIGRCHAEIKRVIQVDVDGNEAKWKWVPCPCQVYAGPELLRGLLATAPLIELPEVPKEDR